MLSTRAITLRDVPPCRYPEVRVDENDAISVKVLFNIQPKVNCQLIVKEPVLIQLVLKQRQDSDCIE
jgi:hypothetical protein